jgi:hypothetical protein
MTRSATVGAFVAGGADNRHATISAQRHRRPGQVAGGFTINICAELRQEHLARVRRSLHWAHSRICDRNNDHRGHHHPDHSQTREKAARTRKYLQHDGGHRFQ